MVVYLRISFTVIESGGRSEQKVCSRHGFVRCY